MSRLKRMAFAAVTLVVFMLATGRMSEVTGLPRRKLLQVATQGAILTLNWFLFLTALDLTTVATAELLAYTGPVFVAALSPLVTGVRFPGPGWSRRGTSARARARRRFRCRKRAGWKPHSASTPPSTSAPRTRTSSAKDYQVGDKY